MPSKSQISFVFLKNQLTEKIASMKRRKIDRLCALGLMASLSLALPQTAMAAGHTQGITQAEKTLTIKGQVVDQLGEPLIGATIQVVGKQGGTVTDFDGNFTIKAGANDKLKFSYLGCVDQIVDVAGKQTINVTMKENAEVIQEVVVVGFGTQKKESLTGAVSVVGAKQLAEKGSLASPMEALQGQVPGVMITRGSSAPGDEGWSMKLRGSVSMNSGGPLVIIDGVAGDINSVNSNDIESINFLKDGSAAIYGSRAADGVVIITTKKGKEGKVNVNYGFSVTLKTPGLQPETMSLTEWADGLMQCLENDNNTSSVWYTYAQLAKQYAGSYIRQLSYVCSSRNDADCQQQPR